MFISKMLLPKVLFKLLLNEIKMILTRELPSSTWPDFTRLFNGIILYYLVLQRITKVMPEFGNTGTHSCRVIRVLKTCTS